MASLRAVPEAAPAALGLIRVSKVDGRAGDEFASPDIQRTAIEDHCARAGAQLAAVWEALDESGSQRRSPWWTRLDQAVEAVERGDFELIVVWKYSRAARNRLRWAVAIDRVEAAGGRIESATEPLDVSTSTGRFTRGMLAELNAFEAERIGDVWKEVQARRASRGLPHDGKPRFGYVYVDGLHRPDPVTGPMLASLYRRYVAGESLRSLAAWLNGEGVAPAAGYSSGGPRQWSITVLRGMLDTGFGAGFITVRGSRQRGAHESVMDAGTWEAYQASRTLRRPLRRSESSVYLLSGLVWCGCGSKMGYGRYGTNKLPRLRCIGSTRPGAPSHPASYVTAGPVEAAVFDWLTGQAAELGAGVDASLARRSRATRRRADAKHLAREIVEVDKAIGRLTADHARRRIPDAAYGHGLAELTGERDRLERRRVAVAAEAAVGAVQRVSVDLLADWDLLGVEQRRAGLRGLIDQVVVTGPRVDVVERKV